MAKKDHFYRIYPLLLAFEPKKGLKWTDLARFIPVGEASINHFMLEILPQTCF
jgi:hypothetical protein